MAREHQPKTVEDLVQLAEAYQLAHKGSDKHSEARNSSINTQMIGEEAENGNVKQVGSVSPNRTQQKRKCFICDTEEHLIAGCPFKVGKDQSKESIRSAHSNQPYCNSFISQTDYDKGKYDIIDIPIIANNNTEVHTLENGLRTVKGNTGGKSLSVLRNTGATGIFLSPRKVDESTVGYDIKDVVLADGSIKRCHTVEIHITTPYISGIVSAVVMDNPFVDMIIGDKGMVLMEDTNVKSYTKNIENNTGSGIGGSKPRKTRWRSIKASTKRQSETCSYTSNETVKQSSNGSKHESWRKSNLNRHHTLYLIICLLILCGLPVFVDALPVSKITPFEQTLSTTAQYDSKIDRCDNISNVSHPNCIVTLISRGIEIEALRGNVKWLHLVYQAGLYSQPVT